MHRWTLPALLFVGASVALALGRPLRWAAPDDGTHPSPPTPEVDGPSMDATATAATLRLHATLDNDRILVDHAAERYLVVTVESANARSGDRLPLDVALVMDVSGSMSDEGKMENARAAARDLVSALEEGDRLALVPFSDQARVLWSGEPARDRSEVLSLVRTVEEGGGTNLQDGLQTGLGILRAGSSGHLRRLVLVSDGHANIGLTDPGSLAAMAARESRAGVSTSTIGLGLDYNEDLLAALADGGGGSYHFVRHAAQLQAIFDEELRTMTQAVARNVSLQIDVAPGVRLLEAYGYKRPDATGTYPCFLGDLWTGQTRKVVLRLAIDDPSTVSSPLATVRMDWVDLLDESPETLTLQAAASARLTTDRAEVEAHQDREASILVARAQAAALAQDAAAAYQQEDAATARDRARAAGDLLRDLSSRLAAPELLSQAAEADAARDVYGNAAPSSVEGRQVVKAQKEQSRAYAH